MTIQDASNLPSGSITQCDIAIVGAGAVGLFLARELAQTKLKVVLLEAGDRGETLAAQRDCSGRYTSTLTGRPLPVAHWRALGGSTLRWAGQCGRMLKSDFEKRSWVANSGWPFELSELEPFYERAESLLGLPSPEPDELFSISDDGEPALVSHHFQFPNVRDFRDLFAEDLASMHRVAIFLNAPVVEIQTDESGKKITELHVQNKQKGISRVSAKAFVLAGGGIDNVRLLLSSRSVHKDGLGNSYDQVGRYFMDHPYFCSATCALDGVAKMWPDSTVEDYDRIFMRNSIRVIQFDDAWLRRHELLNCGIIFIGRKRFKAHRDYLSKPVDDMHSLTELLSERVAGYGETSRLLMSSGRGALRIAGAYARALLPQQLKHELAVARSTMEPVPDPESRVRLSSRSDRFGVPFPEIDWRMGQQELDSMDRMHQVLSTAMQRSGLEVPEIRLERSPETGWPVPMQGGRHHIGTTRMHTNPSQGVVDSHCRVHDLGNLFIAGSSVFPTASYVNPTLTILALGLRLADHLKSLYK